METRMDLDAIEARCAAERERIASRVADGTIVHLRTAEGIVMDDLPALVARVRKSESTLARIRALLAAWNADEHAEGRPGAGFVLANVIGILEEAAHADE